jgi:hypothetical protein
MTHAQNIASARRNVRYALMFSTLAVLALVAPRTVSGAETTLPGTTWKECTDAAFADYNDCLMESASWFSRKICDLAFEGNILWCSTKFYGALKEAATPQA